MKIKYIALNIWQGNLLDNAISFVKSENPDIISLNEVYNEQSENFKKNFRTFEILKKELKYKFYSFAPAFFDLNRNKALQGNAVFSVFPIISEEVTFYDFPFGNFCLKVKKDNEKIPRNIQHVVLKIKENEINVFNTHGIWGFNGKDNRRRLKMSNIIVNKIKDKKNVILSGDFNVLPNTKTIENIERYLTNVFKNELKTSFNMQYKEKKEFSTSVVDMIFTSRIIKILDHYCPNVNVSDHLPLVSVLKF